jgi:hypothetical protein
MRPACSSYPVHQRRQMNEMGTLAAAWERFGGSLPSSLYSCITHGVFSPRGARPR